MSEQEEPAEQSDQDGQTDQDDQAEPTEHSESEKPPPFDADRRGCRTNFCDVRYADCGDCLCSGLSSFLVLAMSVGLLSATAGIGAMGRRLRHEPQAPDAALAAALHRGVRYYQLRMSPRRRGHGGCRYTPTCSAYAAEALRTHGARRGLSLTAARLRRCRPGQSGGADPVPTAARPR